MKRAMTSGKRLNHEPSAVTATLGWRYHHIGIPHTQPRAQEHHVAHLGVHVSGFETSPYGIEWIRFEPHCHVPEIVKIVPHIAFAVDDGAPVELLEFYAGKAVRPKTRHA